MAFIVNNNDIQTGLYYFAFIYAINMYLYKNIHNISLLNTTHDLQQ